MGTSYFGRFELLCILPDPFSPVKLFLHVLAAVRPSLFVTPLLYIHWHIFGISDACSVHVTSCYTHHVVYIRNRIINLQVYVGVMVIDEI